LLLFAFCFGEKTNETSACQLEVPRYDAFPGVVRLPGKYDITAPGTNGGDVNRGGVCLSSGGGGFFLEGRAAVSVARKVEEVDGMDQGGRRRMVRDCPDSP